MFKIIDSVNKALQENIRVELKPGERILNSGLASWQINNLKVINANVFITNMRLIVEDNIKSAKIAATGGIIGGAVGGEMSLGVSGAMMDSGAAILMKNRILRSKTGGFNVPLSDIISVTPGRYKMFGFIPTTNVAAVIKLTSSTRPITLLFNNRDAWVTQIKQVLEEQNK